MKELQCVYCNSKCRFCPEEPSLLRLIQTVDINILYCEWNRQLKSCPDLHWPLLFFSQRWKVSTLVSLGWDDEMEGKHRDRVDLAKLTEQARLHPHWYLSRELQSGKHHAGLSPQQSEDSIRPVGHKKASLHRMYNKCAKDLDPVSCQKAEKLMHVALFDFSKNTFF